MRLSPALARRSRQWLLGLVAVPVALTAATSMSGQTRPGSAFAKGNLHAWAYEEYDAVTRTASERAQVLKKLGITRAGFIGRNVTRMNEFDAYVTAYREHSIQLVAVWTPVNTASPLEEPHIKMFLDGVDRHRLKIQWWVTLEQFERVPEAGRLDAAVGLLRTLHAEATKKGLQLAVYGHGRDAWYTQPENEIAIVEKLAAPPAPARVGIAYNFHHAHSQLDRFAAVLPRLVPHLIAVNLNGMRAQGPMILPIGDGDREQEMIGLLHRAGFRDAVGILAHTRTMDAAVVFERNMEGLRKILTAIGDTVGASSYSTVR